MITTIFMNFLFVIALFGTVGVLGFIILFIFGIYVDKIIDKIEAKIEKKCKSKY